MTNLTKLIDSLTQNPNDITFGGVAHVMQVIIDIYANAGKAGEVIKVLVTGIEKTLNENLHLADGDVCTLYALKQALAEAERIAGESL